MKSRHGIGANGREKGVTLLEVLVTILIVTVGLLGLAGLQMHIQSAEIESYQRVQAIVLMQDMVDRLRANRHQATSYATSGAAVGTGSTLDCTTAPPANGYLKDLCDWHSALLGASETGSDGSTKLGAMIGARGCITNPVTTMPHEFVVAVAWQGLTPTAAPTGSTCGTDEYGTDTKRRVITTRVVFSCLQNQADGTTCEQATP